MNMLTSTCGNHQWNPIPSPCTQLHLLTFSEMNSTLEKYEIARYQR